MDFLSSVFYLFIIFISVLSLISKWNISLQCVCITLTALRTINSINNLQMLIDVSSYLINRYRGYITMDDETWLAMSKYIESKTLHEYPSILTHMHSDKLCNPDRRSKSDILYDCTEENPLSYSILNTNKNTNFSKEIKVDRPISFFSFFFKKFVHFNVGFKFFLRVIFQKWKDKRLIILGWYIWIEIASKLSYLKSNHNYIKDIQISNLQLLFNLIQKIIVKEFIRIV